MLVILNPNNAGFVHRDVRWANVIFLPAEKRWLLIDLDHAGRSGCDCRYALSLSLQRRTFTCWTADSKVPRAGCMHICGVLRSACMLLAACSGEPYPLRFWSKRTLDDGKYTFRSDLRMAAEQLLCGLPYDLDDGGINLRMQVRAGLPLPRHAHITRPLLLCWFGLTWYRLAPDGPET